jgi:tetratricopeptide (TPR) repeat protein
MKTLYIKHLVLSLIITAFFAHPPAKAQQEKIYFVQALKSFKECNYKTAKEDFTKAINFDDKTGESFAYRARCAIFLGDFDNAKEDLTQADALIKNNAQLYLSYGYLYNEMKEYKKAIDVLDKALKIDGQLAEALNARGFSKQSMGDVAGALNDYTAAIKSDGKYAIAYNNHGAAIYYNQDVAKVSKWDLKNALYDFTKAIELDSSLCVAHRNKALVLKLMRENGEAMNEINTAIDCEPGNADNYLTRGIIKSEIKAPTEAIADFEMALSKDPNMGQAYIEMARAKARLKRYEEAYADLDHAEQIAPNAKPEIFYARAMVAATKGHKDDMIHYLNQAKRNGFFDSKSAVANFKEDNDFMMMRSKPDYIKFVNSLR